MGLLPQVFIFSHMDPVVSPWGRGSFFLPKSPQDSQRKILFGHSQVMGLPVVVPITGARTGE